MMKVRSYILSIKATCRKDISWISIFFEFSYVLDNLSDFLYIEKNK